MEEDINYDQNLGSITTTINFKNKLYNTHPKNTKVVSESVRESVQEIDIYIYIYIYITFFLQHSLEHSPTLLSNTLPSLSYSLLLYLCRSVAGRPPSISELEEELL